MNIEFKKNKLSSKVLRRAIIIVIPVLILLATVAIAFVYTREWEETQLRGKFERRARILSYAFERRLEFYLNTLVSIESFFSSTKQVDRNSFHNFVRASLVHPGVQSFSWNIVLPDQQRISFERKMRRSGFPHFEIQERNADHKTLKARRSAEYVFPLFIESNSKSQVAMGFSLSSFAARFEALQKARDTGSTVATRKIQLIQEQESSPDFLAVYLPIYKKGLPHNSVAARRSNILGYVSGTFRIGDLVEASLRGLDKEGVNLVLEDELADPSERVLYSHYETSGNKADSILSQFRVKEGDIEWRSEVDFAGRTFAFKFLPTKSYLSDNPIWKAWLILFVGILFSIFFGIFLFIVTGQTSKIEAVVVRRTEELQNSEAKFRNIVRLAPIGIFQTDPAGKCLFVSDRWCTIFGHSAEVVIGIPWFDIALSENKDAIVSEWQNSIHENRQFHEEYEYTASDETIKWVSIQLEPIRNPLGPIQGHLGVVKDITEQRRTERLIADQQTKMLAASKMSSLGEMAGGMAHEINTPLTIIGIRAAQIKNIIHAGNFNEAVVEEAVDKIESTTFRIAKIIQGLRTFARDGHDDPFEPYRVKSIIDDTLAFCHERFKHHGIKIRNDVGIADRLTIQCRPTEISQVLLNLLNNSYDAIDSLEEKWIRIEVLDDNDSIVIAITDSGKGIDASLHDKIMQPFFTTKSVGKGTGLGLSISKGIIEGHAGSLSLDQNCANTRFLVRLPKVQNGSSIGRMQVTSYHAKTIASPS